MAVSGPATAPAGNSRRRERIDPLHENRWFAVDVELKLIGAERALMIKQARPYSFGRPDVPADCRDL